MKQHEAVIKAMEENGGFATLGFLYRKALQVPGAEWKTKTPFASIRRIVQDKRFFFKIRPGLWALQTSKHASLNDLVEAAKDNKEELHHSYYQVLLVKLRNLKSYKTFVPSQDRNRIFLARKLGDVATLVSYLQFTYENVLRRGQTVDVTWFNDRGFPAALFEVEHSTDMQNSMLKFLEFQDFRAEFNVVFDGKRMREFEGKLRYVAFAPLRDRIRSITYERLSEYHTKAHEAAQASIGMAL